MLHNNANWLQTQQQQQHLLPQQPQNPQQQQQHLQLQQQQYHQPQQQHSLQTLPAIHQEAPVSLQQQQSPPQLYASQMFQHQQQQLPPPASQQYWPEEQPTLSYGNYFTGSTQQPPLQQQPQPQPALYVAPVAPTAECVAPMDMTAQQFYQPVQPAEPVLQPDAFDNNNTSKNDGWGDWGDWNDNANNNNNNNSNSIAHNNNNEAPPSVSLVDDAFNVQGQGSWNAFGNNNNNNIENKEPLELPPLLSPSVDHLTTVPEPELNAIVPPRAFQNQPPVAAVTAAPALLPPPSLSDNAAASAANPFKRSGGPSKRVNILTMTSPTGAVQLEAAAPMPAVPISAAPMAAAPISAAPIAAVPISVAPISAAPIAAVPLAAAPLQTVSLPTVPVVATVPQPAAPLAASPLQSTPGVAAVVAPTSTASLVAAVIPVSVQLQPEYNPELQYENQEVLLSAPNDERAQYLQTSHLSEQIEEANEGNWEADGLLPPPGLSRLVLGQPELVEQQRLVTGIEQPLSTDLHMSERQADGEDTSEDEPPTHNDHYPLQQQQLPSQLLNQQQQQQTPSRRVVTGVETLGTSALAGEQREVVLDGENLDDQRPVFQPMFHPVVQTTPAAAVPVEQLAETHPPHTGNENVEASIQLPVQQQQQHHQQQQQQLHDQQTPSMVDKKHARAKPRPGASLDLESEDESEDDWLLSERHEPPPRRQPEERSTRSSGRRHYNNNYEGETEDSVRGGAGGTAAQNDSHSSSKSTRDGKRRSHDVDNHRRNEPERSNRDRGERERDRDRNWWRHEEQQQQQKRRSRYSNNNSYRNYDGESDAANQMAGQASDGGGGRSSKASRQRRSNVAADDDYEDYDPHPPQRGSQHYGSRREKREPLDKPRGGRRSHDGERTLERRRQQPSDMQQRHWDQRDYEEYRRKSSRNSDLEKERTNGGGSGAGKTMHMYSNPKNAYEQFYDQISHNPQAYADMCTKFYGQMINSMTAAVNAAAVQKSMSQTQVLAQAQAQASAIGVVNASQLLAASGSASASANEAALLKERERYTHAYITQANEFHRRRQQQYSEQYNLYQQQQQQHQQQQPTYNYADLLNTTLGDDSASLYGSDTHSSRRLLAPYGFSSSLTNARSLSNLNCEADGVGTVGGYATRYYAGSECGVDIRTSVGAVATTYAGNAEGIVGVTTTAAARPPRRRTPLLYTRPHLVVSYSMSLLLRIRPKFAGRGRLRNDVEVAAPRFKDATSNLLRAYPGPLQGRKLHKDKIISFCKEQIRMGPARACTVLYATQKKPQGHVDKYRASHALMWNLLILLLRQNGVIADTDVGDLLLENQREYPYAPELETEASTEARAISGEALNESDGEAVAATATAAGGAETELAAEVDTTTGAATISVEAATDQFRSYVLRGNVEEALQWATDHNLWTHAFFLALYEDRYALTDVAHKFLNRAVKVNDPLQTLYQMKSCHTPACVTQLRDENWGDWRSHLSILVTNKSRQPEHDRNSVVALGDTLFQRGDIYAAHFCYLVAQEEFGRYDSAATELTTLTGNMPRLILLGASHYKTFNEFASNEAIIMTEIYEYARSLYDQKFSIVNFQHYKFLLATRILDYGQHFRCTNYLEQIGKHIELKPDCYESDFIHRVCGLAERLRYHDPILINRVSFATPPNASNGPGGAQGAIEEKEWSRQLLALADKQPQQEHQQNQADIDKQFVDINKQMHELNMQYEDTMQHAQETQQEQQLQLTQEQEQEQRQMEYYKEQNQLQLQSSDTYAPQMYYDPNAAQQQQQQPHLYDNSQQQLYDSLHQQPQQQQQQQQLPTVYAPAEPASEAYPSGNEPAANYGAAATPGYDYWNNAAQQPFGDEQQQARPTISMPKSKSYDDDDGAGTGSTAGGAKATASNSGAAATNAATKQQSGSLPSNSSQGNQNSGWIGGLWNKLSLKPKNQMILPDDKNPTIVWDKERKCWTNTEGNVDETESFKPPPKMSDMGMGMPAPIATQNTLGTIPTPNLLLPQQNSHELPNVNLYDNQIDYANYAEPGYGTATAATAPPTVPLAAPALSVSPAPAPATATTTPGVPTAGGAQPKLQSNMFKIKRNRTLKNSYVDVFNPSGAAMSAAPQTVMAPIMAPVAVPQGGFFVPGAVPTSQQQQPQ